MGERRVDVLAMPWDELISAVESAAAMGDRGAAARLDVLLEHEEAGGDLDHCAIHRLACVRYLGRGHGRGSHGEVAP